MAQLDVDRDLLFGLLAVQIGVVTRDDLVEALSGRMLEPRRPLARIFRERGRLDGGDEALIGAMVERLLRAHGGDPRASVTALDSAAIAVVDLLKGAPANPPTAPLVGATVGDDGMACANGDAATVGREPPRLDGPRSGALAGPRFRILRPHARGGIGQVSVALDTELNREVALKEIQPELADHPGSRNRFLLEAEVTGRLEHPGIVPVYALGTDDGGRPYYVMRFVRGETLRDAIATFHAADNRPGRDPGERALALRKLLGRFLEVCRAFAYAHSQGVVHRDLKPSNILLGPYGETLIIDWGLAKVVGPSAPGGEETGGSAPRQVPADSGETMAGAVIGTPSYMSPEQAAGRPELVGTASDVYGLGATLYCLLTGRSPVDGRDVTDVLEKVRRGAVAPPSQVNRRVPPALDAVVRKAMALDPADRYASAQDLAEDVEHWLADEPVSAWREPWLERARRWRGRHQKAVAAAAAAVLVATASLAAATVVLRAANSREAAARETAERHFQLACTAVDRFFTKISDDPRLRVAGLEKLRRDLLEQARDFYEVLLKETAGDPRLQAEQGRTYLRLVRISQWLDEFKLADELNASARAILDPLARRHPGEADYQADRALSLSYAALSAWSRKDYPVARLHYAQCAAIWDGLARAHPGHPTYRLREVEILNRLGRLLYVSGLDREQGEKELLRSLALCQDLLTKRPDWPEALGERAEALAMLGTARAEAGKFEPAREALEEAFRTRLALARDHPDDPVYLSHLARSFAMVATACCNARRPETLPALYEAARPFAERLAREHPDVPIYQEEAAGLEASYAAALALLGHHARAVETAARACDMVPRSAMLRYGSACVASLASRAARADASLPVADRAATAERYLSRAMDSLRQARKLGIFQTPAFRENLRKDPDFDPLRGRDDFERFVTEVTDEGPAGG